jgi:hypothetical protein
VFLAFMQCGGGAGIALPLFDSLGQRCALAILLDAFRAHDLLHVVDIAQPQHSCMCEPACCCDVNIPMRQDRLVFEAVGKERKRGPRAEETASCADLTTNVRRGCRFRSTMLGIQRVGT